MLIALWSLSPIGGQASLRVLTIEATPVQHSSIVQYMDMNSSYVEYMAGDTGSQLSPVDALFLSSMAAPASIKAGNLDSWGNMKIPMLEELPQFSNDQAGSWYTVNEQNSTVYSSLLGVPMANVASHGNSTFGVETSYWKLNCPTLIKIDNQTTMLEIFNPTSNNSAADTPAWVAQWGGINSTSTPMLLPSGQYRCNGTDPNMPARTIQYASYDIYNTSTDSFGTFALCTIETSYVELAVYCNNQDCTVERMRRSTLLHPPVNFTELDTCNGYTTIPAVDWFEDYFAQIITETHS